MELEFSNPERTLLVLCVLVSMVLFARDITPKIRHILAGRSDRDRTDRIGERLLVVVKEVLFQTRVIGGRPVAGTLHAMVFVGFLFFGIETLDHFLEPFGLPFLDTLFGGARPLFNSFLFVISIIVLVGIMGLFYRRFFMVKISPGPKSYSSGLVALMIALLMVTYMNGVQVDPLLPRSNWWVHALLIVCFPPLILRSKHFHLLIGPITVFFRTLSLGEFVPLELDEETLMESEEEVALGLETVADLPWKMRMDFLSCVECRRCTDNCPAATCDQELQPRAFILAGRAALGQDDAPVVGTILSEEALGQCTSCGACEDICPVGIEHLQLLLGAKQAQALATGQGMVAGEFLEKIEQYGNPFGKPASDRKKLIEELSIPIYEKGETEYLLWMGCVSSFNEDARSSLEAMVQVLEHAGVSYGVLPEESCSGHHSRRQGEELQFQTLANENIERFQERGVDRILSPCPHCLHTFRREYPTIEKSFEVETVHHSELIGQLLAEGKISLGQNGNDKTLTYHDPCYLGRYEKVYEPPREVIERAGYRITELARRRERSFCCGGGSAGFIREQDVAKRVDQERKQEIADSGAEILVTACPECKMMLTAATEETLDLAELVAQGLPRT